MDSNTISENILKLEKARLKMELVDLSTLDQDQKNKWAVCLNDLNKQINDLRSLDFDTLDQEFKDRAPELSLATDKLADELARLQDGAKIIKTVASSLNFITAITKLVT